MQVNFNQNGSCLIIDVMILSSIGDINNNYLIGEKALVVFGKLSVSDREEHEGSEEEIEQASVCERESLGR
jgi:hypothetical protein